MALEVSMYGEPMSRARRALVQHGTKTRPSGWQETPVAIDANGEDPTPGLKIKCFGRAPWQVLPAQIEVSLDSLP